YMFFFNDTATTEIYTLSLHDALPIFGVGDVVGDDRRLRRVGVERRLGADGRSEEHTSELQSPMYLGCRLLLEKKLSPRRLDGFVMPCRSRSAAAPSSRPSTSSASPATRVPRLFFKSEGGSENLHCCPLPPSRD